MLPITYPQLFVIIGFVLVLAELIVGIQTGFDLVLIGSIIIIGGLLGIAASNFTITLIVSAILAFVYIAFGRNFIKQKIVVITHKTNIDKLVGKKGVVIRSITPDTTGMVRLDDEDWRAASDEVVHEKDKIEVVSIEGVTLKVKKIN